MNQNLHFAADYAAEQLENYISIHQLGPHDRLPSERKLAAEFNVNRITLREAIARLENEHILYSIIGSGTYIAEKKLRTNTGMNFSFHEYCEANGYKSSSKVVNFYKTIGTDFICQKLSIPLCSQIYILKRLRLLNKRPAMIETSHIAADTCPGLDRFDFYQENASLYSVLTHEYHIHPSKTAYSVSMAYADIYSASLLNIKERTPLLSYDIISSAETDQIIEYVQTLKRSDCFGINSDLYPLTFQAKE